MVDADTTVLIVQIILMVNSIKEMIVLGFAIKRDYAENFLHPNRSNGTSYADRTVHSSNTQ